MTPETKQEIIRLTKAGRPFDEISVRLRLSKSIVQRVAREHNLIQLLSHNVTRRDVDAIAPADSQENAFLLATSYLKRRYKEFNGGFLLDGRPASVGDIMLAANRLLHERGHEQLSKNPDWIVR